MSARPRRSTSPCSPPGRHARPAPAGYPAPGRPFAAADPLRESGVGANETRTGRNTAPTRRSDHFGYTCLHTPLHHELHVHGDASLSLPSVAFILAGMNGDTTLAQDP